MHTFPIPMYGLCSRLWRSRSNLIGALMIRILLGILYITLSSMMQYSQDINFISNLVSRIRTKNCNTGLKLQHALLVIFVLWIRPGGWKEIQIYLKFLVILKFKFKKCTSKFSFVEFKFHFFPKIYNIKNIFLSL